MASVHGATLPTSLPTRRKRKHSKENLLKILQVLSDLSSSLPPGLPTSLPPPVRLSPAPAPKRKADSSYFVEAHKRPRTDVTLDSHLPSRHPQSFTQPLVPSRQARLERVDVSEDQDTRGDSALAFPTITTSASTATGPSTLPPSNQGWPSTSEFMSSSTHFVPVRRPKRGRLSNAVFDEMHDKYHKWGRMLKYSGDARFWSTYPSTHKEYRPLSNPPLPNSPYHKFGGLIARLELLDALVCFTYSIWTKDYSRRQCVKETWKTIEAFLGWCKHKWAADDTVGEREKMFLGLIHMIEAYINARKIYYTCRYQVQPKVERLLSQCREDIMLAMKESETGNDTSGASPGAHGKNPQMLPSPASIGPTNSARSTPLSQHDGTPDPTASTMGVTNADASSSTTSASRRAPSAPGDPGQHAHCALPIPLGLFPTTSAANGSGGSSGAAAAPCVPEPGTAAFHAVSKVGSVVSPAVLWTLHDLTSTMNTMAFCADRSVATLTLPLLARHFPVTFARMMCSSLLPSEESEADMEDSEGELCWPGHSSGAEGLGWVCLMGRSMIREFGVGIGYKGLEGVVPKPNSEEDASPGQQTPVGPPPGTVPR